jgi:hypothetical protein
MGIAVLGVNSICVKLDPVTDRAGRSRSPGQDSVTKFNTACVGYYSVLVLLKSSR